MWSYYGAKTKIVNVYPAPKFNKIIEPFAGTARYSLKYFENDILLVDKYDVIVKLWQWLQKCSPSDIINLPNIKPKQNIRELNLTDEEKNLIGFCIGRGNSYSVNVPGNYNSWANDKKRIAANLFKIKHWEIKQGDYIDIPNEKATWFIDPPYQKGGHKYKFSNKHIDFSLLGEWCKERNGQSIVCEGKEAKWLDFKPLIKQGTLKGLYQEVIWSNFPTEFDHIQQTLF